MLVIHQLEFWEQGFRCNGSKNNRNTNRRFFNAKKLKSKTIINEQKLLNVKTKVLDGRIFITGKVDTIEEKLRITKLGWEIKGARSVKNDLKIKEEFNFKQTAKDVL